MYTLDTVELILTVPSIEETAEWYERVLGWSGHFDTFDAAGNCLFGSVMCGDPERILKRQEPFKGFDLSRFSGEAHSYSNEDTNFSAFLAVDDVDEVFARAVKGGAAFENEPEDQLWGGRTFSMRDLNGFRLTFFQLVEDVSLEEIRRRYDAARESADGV
jgi:uncharacterized glyoxalase superfamily protein PhnB